MKILAIDTSCDETSASVVEDNKILSNILPSQIEFHKEWGGVVPSLAKRLHAEKLPFVIKKALIVAKTNINEVDYFAVTHGPGLAIALEVGINKAKELATEYKKPLIPINHMEGHIYSTFAANSNGSKRLQNISFPYLVLLTSGNHTELLIMNDHGKYQKLGEKLDDAIGEAFDKVGRMLGFGYPGGPVLAKFAEKGDPQKYKLPVPLKGTYDYNFSYSGLKTASLYLINKLKSENMLDRQSIYDICSSFQVSAIKEIILKTQKALENYTVNGLILGGGVSANIYLKKELRKILKRYNIPLYQPLNKKLCMDNAAMIGVTAYWKIKEGITPIPPIESIERNPRLSL